MSVLGIMLAPGKEGGAMQWFYGHLEMFVLGLFATGIALHFLRRRGDRRLYLELRYAYEDAIRETRESGGAPSAVVHEAELQRSFTRSGMPRWFEGFGRTVARWAKFSAIATLVALFLRGPILRGEADYARRTQRPGVASSRVPADSVRR
jgi:hypothetical protein